MRLSKFFLSALFSCVFSFSFLPSVFGQALTGTDFWFTLPKNQGNNNQEYYIYVVSQYCIDSAYLELPFFNQTQYFSVEAGEFYKITVPNNNGFNRAYHEFADVTENKSVHLVSPKPVSVYLLNYSQFTPDGETLIPLSQCGTEYVLTMRGNGNFVPIRNTVIATENGTTVNISSWDQFGNPYNQVIALNRGETFLWETRSDCSGDYNPVGSITCQTNTGSRVTSNKKIVCFSSIDCSNIGACGNCDALMATYLPVSNWATRYVTAQVIQRNTRLPFDNLNGCSNGPVQGSGDYIEITGAIGTSVTIKSQLGTQVQVIPPPSFGNYGYGYIFFELPPNGGDVGEANTEITANAPIQVLQYTKGRSIDNNPTADPEALYVFAPNLWQNSYFFYPIYTPTAQTLEMTIIVEDIGSPLPSSTILINGINVGATGWVQIPNTNFKYKRIADPEFVSSRIESSNGAKFGFYYFARNERETAFFSGGYGPLNEVSLCEQCADLDIVASGSYCVNSNINFTPEIYSFTVPSNLSYRWEFGDGNISTQANPSHSYASFGNYPVKLTITKGSCQLSTTRFVQINDIAIDATPADSLICPGDTVFVRSTPTLQPSSKVTNRYINSTSLEIADLSIPSFWNGTSGSPILSSITVNDNYVSSWTLDSVCVNIKHSKIGDVGISLESPCGSVFILSNNGNTAGRANYRKTCFSSSAIQPVGSSLAPFTGNFIPSSGAGIWPTLQSCNPKGTWNLRVGDDSVLVGGTLLDWSLYFSTSNAINNLNWTPSSDISSTTTPNVLVYPPVDRNYVISVQDFNQCNARDTVKITLSRNPVKLNSRDTVVCSTNGVFNLFKLLDNNVSRSGFWTDESLSGKLVDSLFYIDSTTIGAFNFKYRVPIYCGFDSAIVRITVNKLPNLGLPGTDTICNTYGSYPLIIGLNGNPDNGGIFTSNNIGGGSMTNSAFLPLSAAEGDYIFYYKKPTQGCVVDSTRLDLRVLRQRNPGIGYDTTLCEQIDSLNLFQLLKGSPNTGGQWVDQSNTGKMSPDGKFSTVGLPNGIYTFRYRFFGNQPCADTATTMRITLQKAPFADLTTITPKLCKDSTATVQINLSGNGPFDLKISNGTDTTNYSNTSGPISFQPTIVSQTTFKVVSLIDRTSLKCPVIFKDSLTITVFPPVEATLIKEDCALDLSSFRAIVNLVGGDNKTYKANGVPFSGSTYVSPPIPNGTVYTIVFNDSTNCSSSIISDKKYCECVSEAALLNTSLKQYCAGDVASATQVGLPVVEPEDTVIWMLHDKSGITLGNVLERRTDSAFTFNSSNPAYVYGKTYYISQVVGNAGDSLGFDGKDTCIDVSRGTPVKWNALPGGTISGNATICAGTGSPVTLNLTGTPPFRVTIGVNGQDTLITVPGLSYTFMVTPSDSTTYTLKSISDGNNPTCSSILNQSIRIRVNQLPTASIAGDAVICEGSVTGIQFFLSGSAPWRIDYQRDGVQQNQLIVFNSNFVLNTTVAGVYKLTAVSDANCVGKVDPNTVNIEVRNKPIANAGPDFVNCGPTVQLNAIPSFGVGKWTGIGTFSNENDPKAYVLPPSFGTYTYTWTETNAPCPPSSDQVTVEILAQPEANAGADIALCGNTTQLNATPSVGFGSWIYDGGNQLVFENVSNPNSKVSSSTFGTFLVVWRESINDVCVDRDTVLLTFFDSVRVQVARYNCNATADSFSVDLKISGGQVGTYVVNGTPITGDSIRSMNFASGSNFNFTVTDKSNCGVGVLEGSYACPCISRSGSIAGTNMEVCEGTQFSIPYNQDYTKDGNDTLLFILHDKTGPELGNIYKVFYQNLFTKPTNTQFNTPYYISAVVGTKSNGPIGVNVFDRCLSVSEGIQVVFRKPSTLSAAPEMVFCSGEDAFVDLVATTPLGMPGGSYTVNYYENTVLKSVSFSGNTYRLPVSAIDGDNYIAIQSFVDANNPGCSKITTTSVKIKMLATPVGMATFPSEVCAGTPVNFRANSTPVSTLPVMYDWDFGNGERSNFANASTIYDLAGNYTVRLLSTHRMPYKDIRGQNREKFCTDTLEMIDTVKVQGQIQAAYTINSTSGQSVYCLPAMLNIANTTVVPAGAKGSNEWRLNGNLFQSNTDLFNFTVSTRGIHQLELIERTSFGCESKTVKSFEVSGPYAEFADTISQFCNGTLNGLALKNTIDIQDISWTFSGSSGVIATFNDVYEINTNLTVPSSENQVNLVLSLTNRDGCQYQLTKTLQVLHLQADFSMNGQAGNLVFCADSLSLVSFADLSTANTQSNYKWQFGNGQESIQSTPDDVAYIAPGEYEVKLTISDPTRICTSSASKFITVNPLPELLIPSDTSICIGEVKRLRASGALNYNWQSSNSAVQLIDANKFEVGVSMNTAPVSFFLSVQGTNAFGCAKKDSLEVTVIDFPGPDNFTLPDTVIIIGDSVHVTLQNDPRLRYQWVPLSDALCATCVNQVLSPKRTTEYTAIVSDIFGCPSQLATFTIFVLENQSLDVPDAFTPNGDGINDIIYPDGLGLEKVLLFEVYNRYGQLVHRRTQGEDMNRIYDIAWDGTLQGKKLGVDNYNYVVIAKYYNIDKPVVKHGNFKLLR